MKRCFKCLKIKELDKFYKHGQMADGHLNKCKECTKYDVKKRYDNPESKKKIIEYEKKRFADPKRKAKITIYRRRMRKKYPGKNRCRQVVKRYIKQKKLIKLPCQICGSIMSEAHHKDYRRPLDIIWLCRKHHREIEGKECWI